MSEKSYASHDSIYIDPLLPAEESSIPPQEPKTNCTGIDLTPFLEGMRFEVPLSGETPTPPKQLPVMVPADETKIAIPRSAKPKKGPSPYDVAHEVAMVLGLRVHSGTIYQYAQDRGIYFPLSNEALLGAVYDFARTAVSAEGTPDFPRKVLRILQDDGHFKVQPQMFTKDVVAFKNVNVNIRTRTTCPHAPSIFLTRGIDANWAPEAPCAQFERFLQFLSGDDEALVHRIWEVIGYILSPDTSAKRIFVIEGVPNSGKSLLIQLICSLMFPTVNTVVSVDLADLAQRFAAAAFADRALCIIPDMPNSPLTRKNVGFLKSLSGGDLVSGDRKYQDRIQFVFAGKIVLVTNHAISLKEDDSAFEDRLIRIPFTVGVPRSEQDHALLGKFLYEADGIATTAIYRYFSLIDSGYSFSGNYESKCEVENNGNIAVRWSVTEFVNSHVVEHPDEVLFPENAWKAWKNLTKRDLPLQQFCSILYQSFPDLARNRIRKRKERGMNPQVAILGYKLI